MSRPQTVHTLESLLSRTIEVGDCLEWQGYFATGKRVPYVHDCTIGKMTSVRGLIARLIGRDMSKADYWSARCGNWRCVCPDHLVGHTRKQHMAKIGLSIDHNNPVRIAKLQASATERNLRKLTQDDVTMIRSGVRSAAKCAVDFGVSKSMICRIRRGESWRQVAANHWAGLMR